MDGPKLLSTVALAYVWVAVDYYRQGRYGMAVAFVAYALGNLGFILDIWLEAKK